MTIDYHSWTAKCVSGPILELRNSSSDAKTSCLTEAKTFIKEELVSRIIGFTTVVFALLDFLNLSIQGTYQGGKFLIKKISRSEIEEDAFEQVKDLFKQALYFLGLSIVGTFTLTLYPKMLKDVQEENKTIS